MNLTEAKYLCSSEYKLGFLQCSTTQFNLSIAHTLTYMLDIVLVHSISKCIRVKKPGEEKKIAVSSVTNSALFCQ